MTERLHRVAFRKFFINCVSVCLLVFAIYKTSSNLGYYLIVPRTLAHDFVVNELRTRISVDTKNIHVIQQSAADAIITDPVTPCFSGAFSADNWAVVGMIKAALIDANVGANVETITYGKEADDIPQGLDFAQKIDGLKGVVIIKDDRMALWGKVKIARR